MRKTLSFVLAVVFVLSSLSALSLTAAAAGSSFNSAETISVNYNYSGNIYDSCTENYYKFTLSKPGYISLSFSHDYDDNTSECWRGYIYDINHDEIDSYSYRGITTG